MSAENRLRRRYACLLRAYPRWYRRERGAELLTTLLDAAAAGQRRPSVADVVDTLRGALRCRLRPGRGGGPLLVAVGSALTLALPIAAGTVLLTDYPGPPDVAVAVVAASAALGPPPADVPGPVVQCAGLCDVSSHDGDPVVAYDVDADRTDLIHIRYPAPTEEPEVVVRRAYERLTAAGWHVVETPRNQVDDWSTCAQPDCTTPRIWASFTAARDGLEILVMSDRDRDSGADASLTATVTKAGSAAAAVAAIAGVAGGLLAGWLIGVWTMQRFRRHHLRRRVVLLFVAAPGLALGTILFLATTNVALGAVLRGGAAKDVQIPAFALGLLPPVTWLPAISAVVMVALAALPARGLR